ncbi:MAG: transketolase [Deltaproteobacteria bacterium RIFCSPLOWO2_02_FULL_50_16]|nr:MAG: transketolase [Deltaproteobacteria bacterium GWA2_50_8]OGQ31487.1 MAG: transketolase [Deltaproteobacteria bacterium RIFCSPHIGHO2_02_FULL_50_15]OGQ57462.1 MAG: transketolase [Deltaproteobacteria bacterium RIFCSPLOWO2_02_FULL_50_16]OGQ68572.1 MAG: transketolase [Deltaproteobacteria bacterium RIFCSPLOWO2_12_FULL_50_11]
MADKESTRVAYGKALVTLGEKNPDVVVLDADLSCSTQTHFFAKKFPHRFFNVGVSEQDLMGTAAGLALGGKTVFASSFAMFATGRAFEIVRNSIAYPHLHVIVAASHAGVTVGEDGASHQAVVDVALMRALPHMRVVVPGDPLEAQQMVRTLAEEEGPFYLRLMRSKIPYIYDETYKFQLGKASVLKRGKDGALVAMGGMVSECLEAARSLAKDGISLSVVNMSTIKPLDEECLLALASEVPFVMTVEEHSIIGGLGGAVCECLAAKARIPVYRKGLNDVFGQSGTAEGLLEHYGLTAASIQETVKKIL